MMRFAVSLLLSFGFFLAQAQIIVTGTVRDIDTGKELLGVDVYTENNDYGTATDFSGAYSLALPAGFYPLYFRLEGYRTAVREVEVSGKDTIELNIYLSSGLTSDRSVLTHTMNQWFGLITWEEAGRSVDVITHADREVNNIVQQDELLPKLSGSQVIDGQLSLRGGAGYTPGVNSRVALLYNGLNLNTPGLSEMPWSFLPNGRLEVLKGAASVLYGSGALNGAVAIRSRRSVKEGESETRYALYSSYYDMPNLGTLTFGDSLLQLPFQNGAYFSHISNKKGWYFDTQGQFQFRQGFIEGLDERRIRLHSTLSRTWKVEKELSNERINNFALDMGLMYNEQPNFFIWDSAGSFFPSQELLRQRATTLFVQPYFLSSYKSTTQILRGHSYQQFAHPDTGTLRAYTGSHSLQYELKTQLQSNTFLTFGLNAQYFAQQNPQLDSSLMGSSTDTQRWGASGAAFLYATQEIGQRIKLSFGSRWETFYFTEELYLPELPIFSADFNWRISRSDFLRASWAQGYRMPSLEERYGYFAPAANLRRYPNPNLEMERGWTAELGYKKTYRIGDWYAYSDLALFWMEYDNLIQETFGAVPNLLTADSSDFWSEPGLWLQNAGAARIAGADLSLFSEGKIGKVPLRVWGGYTFSYPEQRDSSDAAGFLGNMGEGLSESLRQRSLPYRNLHTFRLDVQSQLGRLSIGAAFNYQSALLRAGDWYRAETGAAAQQLQQLAPNTRTYWLDQGGQWRIDVRLGLNWNEHTHLLLIVNNILNEPISLRPGRMAAPRTFTVKLQHRFHPYGKQEALSSAASGAGSVL